MREFGGTQRLRPRLLGDGGDRRLRFLQSRAPYSGTGRNEGLLPPGNDGRPLRRTRRDLTGQVAGPLSLKLGWPESEMDIKLARYAS